MLRKVVSFALWAAIASASAVSGQTLDQIGGPAEVPPASFEGDMYVDSRGCVFLRAGYGGSVNWVPRVTADRKLLCGYSPTVIAAPDPSPAPAPTVVGKPMETVATLTTEPTISAEPEKPAADASKYLPAPVARQVAAAPKAAKKRKAAATPRRVAQPGAQIRPGQIGCHPSAPVPQRFATPDGGTYVLCTRGDGTLEGARLPIYPVGVRTAPAPKSVYLPEGYEPAWKDDRLNPKRGVGTPAGEAQQDQKWTREVPARPVAETAPKKVRVVVRTARAAAVKAEARTAGKLWVQVGTFAVPSNAEGVKARLRGAGFTVGSAKVSKAGQPLQIVFAGPFGTTGQAQAALSAVRGAGFADAFIR